MNREGKANLAQDTFLQRQERQRANIGVFAETVPEKGQRQPHKGK